MATARSVRVGAKGASIGQLTHLFTIRAPAGTVAVNETDVAVHVPMRVTAVDLSQQMEYLAAGGLQAASTYVLTCAYREDIRMDSVLIEECHGRRVLQILSRVPTDRHDRLDMVCVERTV